MSTLTETIPKPLIQVAGLTLIERLIESLRAAGVTTFTIGAGWLSGQIVSHLEQLTYSKAISCITVPNYRKGPLQTLVTALESTSKGPFIACPADLIVAPDLVSGFISNHIGSEDGRLLTLAFDPTSKHGSLVLGDGDGSFIEIAKHSMGQKMELGRSAMIIAGEESAKEPLKKLLLDGEQTVAGALNQLASQSGAVKAVPVHGFWHDIDTVDNLLEILPYILRITEPSGESIVVHEGDTIEVGDTISMSSGIVLNNGVQIVGPAFIGSDSVVGAGTTIGPRVSIGENTCIPDDCSITNSILFNNPRLENGARIRNVIAHANAVLPGGN